MVHSSKFLTLRDIQLFRSLSDQQLDQISNQAQLKRFQKGEMIYRTGDPVSSIYIVHTGSVKCGKTTINEKALIKEIVYKQELLGENVITNSKERTEFAQALEVTEVFQIPVSFFKSLLNQNPQLCQELTIILINKMSNLENRLSNFVFKKAQTRIMEFLSDLAHTRGIKIGLQEILVNHGLSHKEIANITDTSRQTVARVLGDLKRQNIIHFSARKPHKILIRDILSLS